jgi:serine/threonine protein kinase
MLSVNKVLRGRYRIIQPLGQGATGAVYEAYDSERETNVALKEILIDLEKVSNIAQRETLKHDFANQAKLLAKVKHESLPQVRGYFSEIDRHYLVMELVDGTDVSKLLAEDGGSTALSEITGWADQLLDTLDYLHTLAPPIVHCDVNPKNVKLTSRGKIKLLGFNIANGADARSNVTVKNQTSATVSLYSSPEQVLRTVDQTAQKSLTENHSDRLEKVLNREIDERSDIYALGATLYRLATGQPPVDALERTLEVWSGKADPLLTANKINPAVPSEISDVLAKAMEIESESRFDSAMKMRQNLKTAVAQAKEREKEEAKNKESAAARESLLAEGKKLEEERQRIEAERKRIEVERKEQAELIQLQLKEAETQRLEAEKRAAEAEKRLSESESPNKVSNDVIKTFGTDSGVKQGAKNSVFTESKSLFAEQEPVKKSSWMLPVAALIFLLVGGAAAGMWKMRSSNAADASKTVSTQPAATESVATEQPPTEINSPPTVEKISETVKSPTVPASPNAAVITASQNPTKNKPAQQAAPKPVKPSVAPPTKVAANQKKAVTVDDIIGGN